MILIPVNNQRKFRITSLTDPRASSVPPALAFFNAAATHNAEEYI